MSWNSKSRLVPLYFLFQICNLHLLKYHKRKTNEPFRDDHKTLTNEKGSWWMLHQALKEGTKCHLENLISPTKNSVVIYSQSPKDLRTRRLRFAGHCTRCESEVVSKVLLWQPSHGRRSRGPPKKDYIKLLAEDTETRCPRLEELHEG